MDILGVIVERTLYTLMIIGASFILVFYLHALFSGREKSVRRRNPRLQQYLDELSSADEEAE